MSQTMHQFNMIPPNRRDEQRHTLNMIPPNGNSVSKHQLEMIDPKKLTRQQKRNNFFNEKHEDVGNKMNQYKKSVTSNSHSSEGQNKLGKNRLKF